MIPIHATIYPLSIAGSILPTFVRPAQRTPPRTPTAAQTKRIPVCISTRRGGPSYTTKGKKGKPTSKHPKPPPPLDFPSTLPPSQDCSMYSASDFVLPACLSATPSFPPFPLPSLAHPQSTRIPSPSLRERSRDWSASRRSTFSSPLTWQRWSPGLLPPGFGLP